MYAHAFSRFGLLLGCFTLLLNGCQPLFTSSPTLSQTHLLTPSLPPPPAPTLTSSPEVPAPASVPALEVVIFTWIPTSWQQSGKWNLQPPYTQAGAPELVSTAPDGYRLDPNFEPTRLEMVYRWVGIGDRVKINQTIVQQDRRYWRGETEILPEAVDKLVQSLNHLKPQPYPLNATTHTDDYPSLEIELTGSDSNQVLLYSDSNTSDYAPWNIVYNGRIYTQFDGQIAAALPGLFTITEGQPLASFYPPDLDADYLIVTTMDVHARLPRSFHGLLPLVEHLEYTPDPQAGTLTGTLRFYGALGGIQRSLDASILGLQAIEVETGGDKVVPCAMEPLPGNELQDLFYQFSCPVAEPGAHGAYQVPIRFIFSTNLDQPYILSGVFSGWWEAGTPIPAVPYPEEIGTILEASPVVQNLLADHQLNVIHEFAEADPATGKLDHRWEADVALLGQIHFGERIIPYSVTVDVKIENGELVQWDLDRDKLHAFIKDVLQQPFTKHHIDTEPELVINLYYTEVPKRHAIPAEAIPACPGLPGSGALPSAEQPLRGFSLNRGWEFFEMQVLLVGDEPRLDFFSIHPTLPEDKGWTDLLPIELQPQTAPPFVTVVQNPYSSIVILFWDEAASSAAILEYQALLEDWVGGIEKRESSIVLHEALLGISETGQISLLHCPLP